MSSQWRETIYEHFETLAAGLNTYTVKAWAVTALATVLDLVVIGLPTAIYEKPFFVRMTPVRAQDYVIWVLSAMLIGLVGSWCPLFVQGTETCMKGRITPCICL